MKRLQVDSNILGQGSVSRDLSAEVVATFRGRHPGLAVTRLDLAATPIGHLTAAHLAAAQGAPVDEALKSDVAMSQVALEEFLAADIVVIGAPMYNLGVPSPSPGRRSATGSTARSDCAAARSWSSPRRAAAFTAKARRPPTSIIRRPI